MSVIVTLQRIFGFVPKPSKFTMLRTSRRGLQRVGWLMMVGVCGVAFGPQRTAAFALSSSPVRSTSIQRLLTLRASSESSCPAQSASSGRGRNVCTNTVSKSRRSFFASSFLAAVFSARPADASVPRVIEKEFQMSIDDGSGNPRQVNSTFCVRVRG